LTTPGIGWVWCDGDNEPVRVRASWVTDDDIAATVAAYRPAATETTVIDLTDRVAP
jgi:hypothetical protein